MKNFIITLGIVIISITILILQSEVNKVRRDISKVEEAANEVVEGAFFIPDQGIRVGELSYNLENIKNGLATLEVNVPKEMEYRAELTFADEGGEKVSKIIKTNDFYKEEIISKSQTKASLELECSYEPFSIMFLRTMPVEINIERRGELIPH